MEKLNNYVHDISHRVNVMETHLQRIINTQQNQRQEAQELISGLHGLRAQLEGAKSAVQASSPVSAPVPIAAPQSPFSLSQASAAPSNVYYPSTEQLRRSQLEEDEELAKKLQAEFGQVNTP